MGSKLAFIGLGVMGGPMAGHLLAGGAALSVHTRTMSRAKPLIEAGARGAESPAEAAAGAEVVFLCLPDTPDVEAVVFGPRGVAEALKPGAIIVDHSTISPAATRRLAADLAGRGIHFLDAPISGGDVGARNATLSIMVGGDGGAFASVLPLLKRMGKTVIHCGQSGNGQLTKLVNQILGTITNLAVCEALSFARRNGLDPAKTIEAVAGGAAGSWQLSNLGPRIMTGDFRPGFTIDLQQKDLRLVLQAAAEARTPLPGLSLVHQLFTSAQAAGWGAEGTQALFKVVEGLASGR